MVDVPYLGLSMVSADSEMVAFVAPANASDLVVGHNFAELLHLRSAGAPYVNCLVEPNSENVCGAPVDQIQVEIILKLWCIQHFVWHFVDPTWLAKVTMAA